MEEGSRRCLDSYLIRVVSKINLRGGKDLMFVFAGLGGLLKVGCVVRRDLETVVTYFT